MSFGVGTHPTKPECQLAQHISETPHSSKNILLEKAINSTEKCELIISDRNRIIIRKWVSLNHSYTYYFVNSNIKQNRILINNTKVIVKSICAGSISFYF